MDADGRLVAADGSAVLDADTRGPILLDPQAAETVVVDGGVIVQDGLQVGRIGVFEMPNRAVMSKEGNGRYTIPASDNPDDEPRAAFEPAVRQGYVESSNVQSIVELTDMMSIMRSYQSVSKFLNDAEDLNKRAIERLGRVS
jgi:flagellar basal-body rod protein FlgF